MDVHNAAQRLLEVMEGRCHCGEDVWRSVLNREAVHLQNRNSLPVATELARNALRQLEIDGIAVFPLSALAGGNSLLDQLIEQMNQAIRAGSGKIRAQREALRSGDEHYKDYLVQLDLTPDSYLPYDAPPVLFALHPELLAIVNAYQRMYTELRKLEFWYTVPHLTQRPRYSQLWHRDPEDMSVVKAFLYLGDVGGESGPFWFARGTHRGDLRWRDPPAIRRRQTNRATDEEIEAIVSRERWVVATGSAGTVILAATKGYHRGGLATGTDRRLLTATYLSRWCRNVQLPEPVLGISPDAHDAVRFAGRFTERSKVP